MLSWFLNMKIRLKVGLSFLLLTLILLVVILIIIQQVKDIESTTKRVINLRSPTAQASLMMLNGMNHSLASLRAWIILGETELKTERSIAWSQQIEPSLDKMKTLSAEWTDPNNVQLLSGVTKDLEKFRLHQQAIEDIAQTKENTPARTILFEQADPLEKIIIGNVTKIVKAEISVEQTAERRKMISLLTDFEATMGLSMEKIEEYLLSGNAVFKEQFNKHWEKNSEVYKKLQGHLELVPPGQKMNFQQMIEARDKFSPIVQKMIAIRSNEEWNQAHFLLKTKAAPMAASINQRLNQMLGSQNSYLNSDLEKVSRKTNLLVTILVGWFFVGGLLCGVLGATITRGISTPLQDIKHTTKELAEGNLRQEHIESITKDELGEVIHQSNKLIDNLKTFRRHANNITMGNLKIEEFDLKGDYKKILNDMLKLAKRNSKPD